MADKQIRIRIGASVDRTLDTVFPSLAAAAKKARVAIESEVVAIEKAMAKEMKVGAAAGTAAIQQFGASVPNATRPAVASIKEFESAIRRTADVMRSVKLGDIAKRDLGEASRRFDMLAANAEQQMGRIERAQTRAHTRSLGITSTVNAVGIVGRAGFGLARSIGAGLARGAGVDYDFASNAKKAADLEAIAVRLSNSGYQAGAPGAAGQRQDPRAIAREMHEIADATASSTGDAIEGLSKFVAKTGDLATGRDTMLDMAKLAKATGASLTDMADAAGDVSNNLGDMPNKAAAIDAVMRAVAGQGKLGAMEIRDFAKQMAKVASAAPQFGGDTRDNITMLGAIAQEARQRGGAASAAQAGTSVQGFVNTLNSPARRRAFARAGVQLEGADGKLRSGFDIIKDSLRASSRKDGTLDSEALKNLFMQTAGARAVQGFANVYRGAGGGEAGMAAVNTEIERLKRAVMSQEEVEKSLSRAMATQESQAQLVNNQFEKMAAEVETALLPALQLMAPALVSFSHEFAEILAKLTGKASPSGIAFGEDFGSVVKARAALEKKIQAGAEIGLSPDESVTDEDRATLKKQLAFAKGASGKQSERADEFTKNEWSPTTKKVLRSVNGMLGKFTNDIVGGNEETANTERSKAAELAFQTQRLQESIDKITSKPLPVAIHEDKTPKLPPPVRADKSPHVVTGPKLH